MEQNKEMRLAWDFVEHTGKSIFLTGKAGTGKTTFLKALKEHSMKRMVVVAPTGVAAINAAGVTIHSFFQLPLSPFVPGTDIRDRYDFGKEKRKIIRTLDILVIDEISMVRSDLLDAIDWVLRRYRDKYKPFGGVQLLMIGDLQQLTPVVTPEDAEILNPYYDTPYFFGSKALQQIDYVTIQLDHVYRQQDSSFIEILNHIRDGRTSADDLQQLNTRCNTGFRPRPEEGFIRLTTHNYLADNYNESELRKLPNTPFTYRADIKGTFPEYAYPTAETLTLKVGAQVMFIKNDPSADHLYYNGRIGHVTYLDDSTIFVHCPGDRDAIKVEPQEWENAKYVLNEETREIESDVQGVFRQFPLRLAWAITIHKSQGLTFDHAIIDANASFASGQVYVALSRCKSLEGLVLSSPIEPRAIINDPRVDSYISRQGEAAKESFAALPDMKEEYYRHQLLELFQFAELLRQEQYVGRLLMEFFSHSHPQLTLAHKQLAAGMGEKVNNVAYKWNTHIAGLTRQQLHDRDFLERVSRSACYFSDTLGELFAPLLSPTRTATIGNKAAMKRYANAVAELEQGYHSKKLLLEKIAAQGFSTATYLKAKQLSMLEAMDIMNPEEAKKRAQKNKKEQKKKERKAAGPKEDTKAVSFGMYQKGMKPKEIARERDLKTSTIITHLAHYVAIGALPVEQLLTKSKLQTIQQAIAHIESRSRSAIKEACPDYISYDDITMALAVTAREGKPHRE